MLTDVSAGRRFLSVFVADQKGVTSIEYGLLAALIAVVCVAAFSTLGGALGTVFDKWTEAVVAAL